MIKSMTVACAVLSAVLSAGAEEPDAFKKELVTVHRADRRDPAPRAAADEGPAWAWTLSTLVQLAACVAIGALAFFLWQNAQTRYF